jgi:16S rRNA (adenine1518-N6/adenine1519-N6)-dimethyltransferase
MRKRYIQEILNRYDKRPIKSMGQNFLLSQNALSEILTLADIKTNDVVVEIGAGTGVLTKQLAKLSERIIAIEKDEKLTLILKDHFHNFDNVKIVQGDIRKIISFQKNDILDNISRYKVIANLPYYLSSFVIRKFLERKNKPDLIVLMLQKELVDRICAIPGAMSLLSIMVQLYATPQKGSIVKKNNFYPKPKVDSRILLIKNIKQKINFDTETFFKIVKIAFSCKRKKLINNLDKNLLIKRDILIDILKKMEVDENIRAQELSIEQWKELYSLLRKYL